VVRESRGVYGRSMSGRGEFTEDEIEEIPSAQREPRRVDPGRKKTIRSRLRTIGFYISDYSQDADGFKVNDFDEMLTRGTIRRQI
jgi:hypothetical protein